MWDGGGGIDAVQEWEEPVKRHPFYSEEVSPRLLDPVFDIYSNRDLPNGVFRLHIGRLLISSGRAGLCHAFQFSLGIDQEVGSGARFISWLKPFDNLRPPISFWPRSYLYGFKMSCPFL